MFLLTKTMPNGAVCQRHECVKFEVHPGFVQPFINSYSDESPDMIAWQTSSHTLPVAIIQVSSLDDVEVFMTATGAPFAGGVIVPKEAATLDQQKILKRARLKLRRVQAEDAGVITPLGIVDSDLDSRLKISGAVTMAMLALQNGQPFDVDWRMANNEVVTHDAQAIIAMGMAVGQHIAACQAKKNALDTAIDAATTEEELAAVDIEAGW